MSATPDPSVEEAFADLLAGRGGALGKPSMRLTIVAYILRNIPWDEVATFALKWEKINIVTEVAVLPIIILKMKNGNEVVLAGDEKLSEEEIQSACSKSDQGEHQEHSENLSEGKNTDV